MKNIFYILISIVILGSCSEFYGDLEDGNAEDIEIVMLNRSSVPVRISVSGASWISPDDTIYLKPGNGLWKIEKPRDLYLFEPVLPITYSVFRVDFNNGEEVVYFDSSSELPHNPCSYYLKEVWDEYKEHRVIEFSDKINAEILERVEQDNLTNMNLPFAPTSIDPELYTLGASEAYFIRTFPVPEIREKLKIGAAIYGEAESVDKIRFAENYTYEPDSVRTYDYNSLYEMFHEDAPFSYFNLTALRNMSLNHYGCDFAALSGRDGDELDKFCGIIKTKYYVNWQESLIESDYEGEHKRLMEESDAPMYVIDNIIYGDIMFLLAEADCSPGNINRYVENHVWQLNYYYDSWYTPEISYHLITMDENGRFRCQSGGVELAKMFHSNETQPGMHPIYFTLNDFKEDARPLHILGKNN